MIIGENVYKKIQILTKENELVASITDEEVIEEEDYKVEMDGKLIAEQTRISTNRLNKLVLNNGIKLDGQEIKGVRSYSIKQDENEITAELTLFMDVRII